jgi:hypothetical protein
MVCLSACFLFCSSYFINLCGLYDGLIFSFTSQSCPYNCEALGDGDSYKKNGVFVCSVDYALVLSISHKIRANNFYCGEQGTWMQLRQMWNHPIQMLKLRR